MPGNVIAAIQGDNVNVGAGQFGMPPAPARQDFQQSFNISSALDEVAEFEQIIVKASSVPGAPLTRAGDVARIEFGAQTYSQTIRVGGRPAGGLAIFLEPGANALSTAREAKATMDRLSARLPSSAA